MSDTDVTANLKTLETLLLERRPLVTLHPAMTALQIADWCQRNRMFVTINYTTDGDGCLQAIISASREHEPGHVPSFLKRQAE